MKQKIVSISIILILVFLSACGTNPDEESTVATTAPNSVTEYVGEGRSKRTSSFYDSVPTVTFPQNLSEDELQAIEIPSSDNDPYWSIINSKVSWYKQYGSNYNFEQNRYAFYDINGDGSDELILGYIDQLGNTDVLDMGAAATYTPTYGLLIETIYTVKNGKAVRTNNFDVRGDAYQTTVFGNGIIKVMCNRPQRPWIYYRKMVGDHFESLGWSIFIDADDKYMYIENGKEQEITKEEFNRLMAEAEGGAKPVELEWKHFQDYGK